MRDKKSVLREVKTTVKENHPDIKGLKVYQLPKREFPSNWNIKSNRWSVKTYPTGLKKPQMYVVIRAEGWNPSIYDVTIEPDGRLFMHQMYSGGELLD